MKRNHIIIVVTVGALCVGSTVYNAANKAKKSKPKTVKQEKSTFQPIATAKTFSFKDAGLSDNQLSQHQELYQGYVKKRNEIAEKLSTTAAEGNVTYTQFRGLKIAETFARNGAILHELYFENLGKSKGMGKQTKALLEKQFGSLENYKEDLLACALSARGWVITAYNLDTKTVSNYVLDAHNETVPVLVIPLMVMDVYEHAYMIDFGIKRANYAQRFWAHIQWDVVEDRVNKWVGAAQE